MLTTYAFGQRMLTCSRIIRADGYSRVRQVSSNFQSALSSLRAFGLGALTRLSNGKYRRPFLFVMTLKYISQDRGGALWLATGTGLHRLDPFVLRKADILGIHCSRLKCRIEIIQAQKLEGIEKLEILIIATS